MDQGMERFEPPIHHLWEMGVGADVANLESRLLQVPLCAAGTNDLDIGISQCADKWDKSRFVTYADECSLDGKGRHVFSAGFGLRIAKLKSLI